MNFDEVAIMYKNVFNEEPPMLTTLETNNELYLEILKNAIIDKQAITRDDLALIFMPNDNVLY